eukprot:TRINITY_DN19810_c0_g1_i1.p1 TRINITY_DN19810_c0_g1~~TRINITY_DN19810_c0_g1_i1.p1  ORF type:complete len:203 (+),score=15.95 TRINITY_DN19810_c0_g1_i1:190-798(+)
MDIFGDFDDSATEAHVPTTGKKLLQPTSIPGLWIIKQLLSPEGSEYFVCHSLAAGWGTDDVNNQAMMFGKLPDWVAQLEGLIRDVVKEKDIPFIVHSYNQLILNRYGGEQGLKPHVDLMRFENHIAGITLCGTASFVFTPVSGGVGKTFFLEQGDAYLMSNEARYNYTHGIPEQAFDIDDDGNEVPRTTRISITLRKLVDDS